MQKHRVDVQKRRGTSRVSAEAQKHKQKRRVGFLRRSVEAQKQKRAEWVLAQMCRSAEWDCPVLLHFCNQIMNCSTDRKIPQQTVQLFLTAALLHIETYK